MADTKRFNVSEYMKILDRCNPLIRQSKEYRYSVWLQTGRQLPEYPKCFDCGFNHSGASVDPKIAQDKQRRENRKYEANLKKARKKRTRKEDLFRFRMCDKGIHKSDYLSVLGCGADFCYYCDASPFNKLKCSGNEHVWFNSADDGKLNCMDCQQWAIVTNPNKVNGCSDFTTNDLRYPNVKERFEYFRRKRDSMDYFASLAENEEE